MALSAAPSNIHRRIESPACCSAAFVSVCLCPPASADVAVPLTPLATIAQLARGPESWGGVALLSKVQVPACAEKQVGGSRPTSWCVTWTLLHLVHVMVVGWRSLLVACPFFGGAQFAVTGLPQQEQQTLMVQLWSERGVVRRERTLNWSTPGRGPDLWCLPVRSQEGVQTRLAVSLGGIFQDVLFDSTLHFGHFWAPLFSRCFYSTMNVGHFWALPLALDLPQCQEQWRWERRRRARRNCQKRKENNT